MPEIETTPCRWYLDGDDGSYNGYASVCRVMHELAQLEVLDGDAPAWEAFSAFIGTDALSQEVYGEYLIDSDGEPLAPMWMAFRAGWERGAAQDTERNAA